MNLEKFKEWLKEEYIYTNQELLSMSIVTGLVCGILNGIINTILR